MNRLKERRLELGLTQPELSRMLKAADPRMDVGMVSRFETGACLPTPEVLAALETALQAPRSELYGEGDLRDVPDESAEVPEMSLTTRALAGAVPFGRRNAIPRDALAEKLGMGDRSLRQAIERARAEGLIILNGQDGRGYYQSDDILEMERQYRQDTARAMSILKRRKPLRAALKAAGREV